MANFFDDPAAHFKAKAAAAQQPGAGASGPAAETSATTPTPGGFTDLQLVEMFKKWKAESFDQRWVYERQWMRNIWYMLNRQWIFYDSTRNQWQDKRLAKWVPRPVTNMCKEAVQTVRANFTAINYGASARPIGNEVKNVVAAGVADDYAPILHEDHQMDVVLKEFDWWMLVCGNAFLHTAVEYDRKNGVITIRHEQCTACGVVSPENAIADAKQKCPSCGATAFQPAIGPDGKEITSEQIKPRGVTVPLSPLEVAFPLIYERYDLAPYTIRLRWRDKSYYENNADPNMQAYAKSLDFGKSPGERTMQIFKTLPFQNDLGMAPAYMGSGGGASGESEGISEYDVWIKPCTDFPDGQVIRFAGDSNPVVIHCQTEGLPGPLPFKDATGTPIFPFVHGMYDHVGGRSLGSGILDPIIQKQDQLNQVDSLILMIIMRTANPIWLEPKGAEVEKFTGEPGLVVKWNPLVAGGQAKPERIPGENVPATLFEYRALLKQEIEELSGTFDILKGQKPAGVEAFASLNLLVERGQARHANAFKERGKAYKHWLRCALEIEREFGEETRTRAVMGPNRGWAFETFQSANLAGSVEILIEDGTLTPKTALGERAMIEHLNQLGMIDPNDPEMKMAIFQKFGAQSLLPGLDSQVQEAWMVFENFEKALQDPQAMQAYGAAVMAAQKVNMAAPPDPMQPMPPIPSLLSYKRWYNPVIHRQELIKWCTSDKGRKVMGENPAAEQMVDVYLQTIDMALVAAQSGMPDTDGTQVPAPPPTAPGTPQSGGGAGRSMANSSQNSAGVGSKSSGPGGAAAQPQNAA